MIRLNDSDVGEFIELWKQETGQQITPKEAREYAENLVGLVQLVLDPEKPP